MESQYPHIHSRPSTQPQSLVPFNLHFSYSLGFKESSNPNSTLPTFTDSSPPPFTDIVMRTPEDAIDFALSPHAFKPLDTVTPFGKSFELSDDWIVSDSYISPIVRAPGTPLRRLSSPAMLFIDRIQMQQQQFSSPLGAVPNARSSPPTLLSPLKLASSSSTSVQKENSPNAQIRFSYPIDQCPSSPLTSPPESVSSLAPKTNLPRATPRRLESALFPLSPLTPLTPPPQKSQNSVRQPMPPPDITAKSKKRRLSMSDGDSPTFRVKRMRNDLPESQRSSAPDSSPTTESLPSAEPTFSARTFPSQDFALSPDFPLFYRRFPASSYFEVAESGDPCAHFDMPHPGGEYRAPRETFDLYSPRFVKGIGVNKMGLCPICVELPDRGGEGKKVWLGMKVSAFKCYHMQFYHGISTTTGRPFSPPTDVRVVARTPQIKNERTQVQQGKCHKCRKWVNIQTVRDMPVKVRELFWWKHAATCHLGSILAGEGDVFEDDAVYATLKETVVPVNP